MLFTGSHARKPDLRSTLFDSNNRWLQKFNDDPLDGWNLKELGSFRRNKLDLTKLNNDLYGNLYFFVKDLLTSLHRKVRARTIHFKLACGLAQDIQHFTSAPRFDRIEVSNITDLGFLGIQQTLVSMRPMLKTTNPKATIISLFKTAMTIVKTQHQDPKEEVLRRQQALRYLPLKGAPSLFNPDVLRLNISMDIFAPIEDWFEEYKRLVDFERAMRETGLRMKSDNTIIPRWPYRLKTSSTHSVVQKDVEDLLASSLYGWELYIEWQLA